MVDISPTIKVNISVTPGVKENILLGENYFPKKLVAYKVLFQEFQDVFAWSYSEMFRLDPTIFEHHIDTWSGVIHFHQEKRHIHPSRTPTIKAKIDKLQKERFIYPITYISWVSNPILIMKQQGTICVYTDLHDLNKACPKDNYPTPFINHIIDECVGHEVLSFMDGFSSYNQICIRPQYQYNTTFTTPWGTFAYKVMPFVLKNVGTTFQRAMAYYFHDLVHLILSYLDNLTAHSKKKMQHLENLCTIFLRCLTIIYV
jgi:hypothetical protein